MKLNMQKGIFLKTYVAQIAIICFAVVITLVSSYFCSVSRLEGALERTNISFINQVHDNIEMQLYNIDRQAINFMDESNTINFLEDNYADNAIRQRTNEEVQARLNTLQYINSAVSEIYLYSDESKRILTSTGMRLADQNDYEEQWMKYISEKNPNCICYIVGDKGNEQIMMVRPYVSASVTGSIKGAIVTAIKTDILFASMLDNVNINSDTTIYIADGMGNCFSVNSDEELSEDLLAKVTSSEKTDEGGKIFYQRYSEYTGWHYINETNSYNGGGASFLLAIVIIGVVMILISFIFIRISNKYTIKPIDDLLKDLTESFSAAQDTECSYADDMDKLKKLFSSIITDRDSMQLQLREAAPAIKWRILSEIANGNIDGYEELMTHFDLIGIRLGNKNYVAAIAEIDNEEYISRSILNELSEHIEEIINQDEVQGSVFVAGRSSLGIIMTFPDDEDGNIMINSLAICELIREDVKKSYKFTISIGIGGLYRDITDARKSYGEAERALKYKLVTGADSIISYQDIKDVQGINMSRYISGIEDIVAMFIRNDKSGIDERIAEFFEDIKEQKLQPEMTRQLAVQIINDCIKSINMKNPDKKELDESGFYNIYYKIMELNDALMIQENVKHAVFMMVDMKENSVKKAKEENSNAVIVEKIAAYINEHYMDMDLSLNKIADEFGLSDAHVSRIFKAHMGINMMNYIIKIRIGKAQEMLVNTDYKISRIAEELGYSHTSFLRIFKQYVGCTPSEYRNIHKEK